MNKQPALVKIITTDYAAFLAFLFPVVAWGFYFIMIVFQNVNLADFTLPMIFAVITIVSLSMLFWRVQVFNTIFNDGIEAPATISNISFFRDRGRVDYIYTFQGQKYVSGNAVHKVRQTQNLQIGEQVIVVVDRNNPKRAFIRDLYL